MKSGTTAIELVVIMAIMVIVWTVAVAVNAVIVWVWPFLRDVIGHMS